MSAIDVKLRLPRCWDFLAPHSPTLQHELHELLIRRNPTRNIDETALKRHTAERYLMQLCAAPEYKNVLGMFVFNQQFNHKYLPVGGVVCRTDLDLCDPRSLQGLVDVEEPGALLAEIHSIRDTSTVVSIRETEHTLDQQDLQSSAGQQLLHSLTQYYGEDLTNRGNDFSQYRRREVSVWFPVPGHPKTLLFQFVLPDFPLTDTLTELCLHTVATVTFRSRPTEHNQLTAIG